MKENNQMSKKRLIAYYAVLATCIVLAAAITITVIVSVNNRNDVSLKADTPADTTPEPSTPDKPDEQPPQESTDVSSKYEFIVPVETVNVTAGYTFYHNQTLNSYYLHGGMDFAAEEGAPVLAALDGTVKSITTGDELYGTVITLQHEGDVVTTYTYVTAAEGLKEGDSVARGQTIATIAKANGKEYKDGAHLHFEVFEKGQAIDPEIKLDIIDK